MMPNYLNTGGGDRQADIYMSILERLESCYVKLSLRLVSVKQLWFKKPQNGN